jgi:hypothetical protein
MRALLEAQTAVSHEVEANGHSKKGQDSLLHGLTIKIQALDDLRSISDTRVAGLCIYISTVERCPAFTTPISAYVNISSKFVYHQTGERPSHNRQVLNPCQPGRKGVDVHVKATEENCWEYEVIWSR